KISRDQALRDLDAINNDEKKTLLKIQKKKAEEKGKPTTSGKDW
ncbi:MAG: BatC protein, partial [Flavobacteriales bacterium]|nr:BatC protein [Flavobacteriales bacterium]